MGISRRTFLNWGGASMVLPVLGPVKAFSTAAQPNSPPSSGAPRHIIIDTDAGVDDAAAIFLAFRSPEVVVDALTVVAGNVPIDIGQRNTRIFAEVGGHSDIPVALGAARPLKRGLVTATIYHGANGMGNVQMPDPKKQLDSRSAVDLIIEHIHAKPGQISIVAIGPMTNIAMALMKDPSIAPEIASLVYMGGTITSYGNTTPVTEFNLYVDPDAAKIVTDAGIPRVVMVPTEVTTKVRFSADDFHSLDADKLGHLIAEFGRFRLNRARHNHLTAGPLGSAGFNDMPAMAALIHAANFTMEPMKVDIVTQGELTLGQTVANRNNRAVTFGPQGDHRTIVGDEPVKPNQEVCVGIDHHAVKEFFLGRLRG